MSTGPGAAYFEILADHVCHTALGVEEASRLKQEIAFAPP